MRPSDILGVVLAGGASRRLGRDKATLPWTGTTLARRAVTVLGEACGEVVVAGPADLAPPGVEAVADRFAGRGPLAGLEAGLERAGGRPIFALACDLPFVDAALVRRLTAAAGVAADAGAWTPTDAPGAWVAADERGTQPLCGLYRGATRAVAERRLRAGRLSVLGFLEAIGGVTVPLASAPGAGHAEPLLNVNRPADLRRARRLQRAAAGASR